MMDVLYFAAGEVTAGTEGSTLPLSGQPNALLPALYDIVWSLVAFIIVLIILWKFGLPAFQKMLTEREDRIKGGIQRAEAAQAEAKAALEKYNEQLSDARAEAAKIRDDAREKGKVIIEEMKAKADEESNRIIEAGERQLAAQREQVVAELRRDMGKNSIDLAEKLLGAQLSSDVARSETIDKFLADLDHVAEVGK